jgi:hypothetical protein
VKNEDTLLEELAQVARDEDPLEDPRWDALARGALTAEEEAELLAQAEGSAEKQRALEAFKPLDERARDRFTDQILASLGEGSQTKPHSPPLEGSAEVSGSALAGSSHAQGEAARGAPEDARCAPEDARPASNVVPFRPKRRVISGLLAAAPLVAAAAAVFFFLRPVRSPAVPSYELMVAGGEQVQRSTPDAPPSEVRRLGPGSSLTLTLRPATRVEGPVAVRGALAPVSATGTLERGGSRVWSPPITITPEGAVRITGTKEALFQSVPAGTWEILVAVGRSEALPSGADALVDAAARASEPRSDDAVRVLRARVLLHDGDARP